MMPPTSRKFTILDGMILVAAVACAFPLDRATVYVLEYYGSGFEQNWIARGTDEPIRKALPFLMTITAAVLLMNLRPPRPRWRRLARQPGMAACSAATVPIIVASIGFAYWRSTREPNTRLFCEDWRGDPLFGYCGYTAGLWILAAWLTLALSGRWRAERSGIDLLGRLVGVGWLLVLAIRLLGGELLGD